MALIEGARLAGRGTAGAPNGNTPPGAAQMEIAEAQAAGQVGEAQARINAAGMRRELQQNREDAAAANTPNNNNVPLQEGTDVIKNNLRDASGR